MTFDARKAGKDLKPFAFIDLEGNEHELPNMKSITAGLVRRLQAGDDDAMLEVAGQAAFDALQEMPAGIGEELANAWADHSGAQGKAPSPSSPTKKAQKPRKRT